MSLAKKILAPLALSFTVAAGAVTAQDASNDNTITESNTRLNSQVFSCDAPNLSGLDLPDRMDYLANANVLIHAGTDATPQRGLGSGFIIDNDGYIVTNNHVVDGAPNISVTFYDPNGIDTEGKTVQATLIGSDEVLDVALLKIDSDTSLPCVNFGDSDKVRLGENVTAFGNPLGKSFSLSRGIISSVNREMDNIRYNAFQTDASVNSGNSGGGLYNQNGEIIGVNTAILSPQIAPGRNAGNLGIAFAIKSRDVLEVAEDIKLFGQASRAGLGIQIQDIDEETANSMNVTPGIGALVTLVAPDRPAGLGGVLAGDIIIEVDGEATTSKISLIRKMTDYDENDQIEMTVIRDGQKLTLDITLTNLEAALQSLNEDTPEDAPAPEPELAPAPAPHGPN